MRREFIGVILVTVLILATPALAQEKPLPKVATKLALAQRDNPVIRSQLRKPRAFDSAAGIYLGLFYGQFFGLGGQFRHWLQKPFGFEANLGVVSITEDRLYFTQYPYSYGGYVSYERSAILFPFYFGVNRALSSKDSNFRFYLTVGLGPVLGVEYTNRNTYPQSLEYSRTVWTFSEFAGINVNYVSGVRSRLLLNLDVRYYFMRFPQAIMDKKNYDGLVVMFGLARMF